MLAFGGYGLWKYKSGSLHARMEALKRVVPLLMTRHDCDGVVLHGSSGVWLGAALVMAEVLPKGTGLFLVRKPGESTHGKIVEGDGITECRRLLMIDDFVSSGNSVSTVQRLIVENKVRPALIVAVLQHERMYSGKTYNDGYKYMHDCGSYLVY